MIVTVRTPNGDTGQVVGFAVEPGTEDYERMDHVLVAIEGKPLEVHYPKDLEVESIVSEYAAE